MWLIVLVIVLISAIELISDYNKKQKNKKMMEDAMKNAKNREERFKEIYNSEKSKIDFPEYQLSVIHLWNSPHYIWKENNNIFLFPCEWAHYSNLHENYIKLTTIETDKIKFYRQKGELYTKVSGDGGNSSFSPITGPHGKINPINIKTEVCDNRNTVLYYEDIVDKDAELLLDFDDYDILLKIIPEKDYQIYTNNFSNKSPTKSTVNKKKIYKLK